MNKTWSFAKITDILQKKIEVSDRINKILDVHPLTWNFEGAYILT